MAETLDTSQQHPQKDIPTPNPNDNAKDDDSNLNINSFLDADGKNLNRVICPNCSSVILEKYVGAHVTLEKMLPATSFKATEPLTNTKFVHFWMVDDIFKFENCGFSNNVEDLKYLLCADCEIGPIGFQNLNDKLCYVALGRVVHI